MPHRVLIIDDDAAVATLLRYNFEAEGCQVTHVGCGAAAQAIIEECAPDLIVLDWSLPKVSGVEICRRLRRSIGIERLPIIMLTARTGNSDRDFALKIGVNNFFTKPFSVRELLDQARRLLGGAA